MDAKRKGEIAYLIIKDQARRNKIDFAPSNVIRTIGNLASRLEKKKEKIPKLEQELAEITLEVYDELIGELKEKFAEKFFKK